MTRAIIWRAVSTGAQAEDERFSLPNQEADARTLAEAKGWNVIDILTVSGHSRRYKDYGALAAAAAGKGIDAFYRLQEHWEKRDFDYLICRDGDRFARSQALFARITEEVIETAKARIWSLNDGLIDNSNYRMWIAMRGMQAASDIDKLVKFRDEGMNKRASMGLPIASKIPISHISRRDPVNGCALPLEVNEEKRRLWDDLALLILEGVAWELMEMELYQRFGHVHDNGKPYYPHYMYRLVTRPLFWGHIARHHFSFADKDGYRLGAWAYDESEPVPEGVTIWRNTHPPVWKGELADIIRGELRRRSEAVRGRATPHQTQRFSGLGVCAECGSFLTTHVDKGYRGLICPASKNPKSPKYPPCSNTKIVNERKVIALISDYLRLMLEQNTTDVFANRQEPKPNFQARLDTINGEIESLKEQALTLIRDRATAGRHVKPIFDEELARIDERLQITKDAQTRLKAESSAEQHTASVQHMALSELATLSVDALWKQESRYINQTLHRLMGKNRLLVLNGEIKGFAEVDRRQRRHG